MSPCPLVQKPFQGRREHAKRSERLRDGRGSPRAPGKGCARAQRVLTTGGTRSGNPNRRRTTAWRLEGRVSCPGGGTRLARGSPVGAGLRTVGGHGEVGRWVALCRLCHRRPPLVVGGLQG